MVNWSDPAEVARDGAVFEKLLIVFLGVTIWEIFVTGDFEWSLITGKRRFKWPLVLFFFLSRYCILLALITLVLSMAVESPINCSALYTFSSWAGNMAILASSTSLMIRTIVLWNKNRIILATLGALCLAHWALLWRGMFLVRAEWNEKAGICVVTRTDPNILTITFFFTMIFDLVITLLSGYALLYKLSTRSGIWKMLFRDGLAYFVISFSTNCVPAVLNVLALNDSMNVIAAVPAAAISSIAACRAVMRLIEFQNNDTHIHTLRVNPLPRIAPGKRNKQNSLFSSFDSEKSPTAPKFAKTRSSPVRSDGVHITTEQITMTEFPFSSVTGLEEALDSRSFASLGRQKEGDLERGDVTA